MILNNLTVVAFCYAIGSWGAALFTAVKWLTMQPTSLHGFLRLTGWFGVATILVAILFSVA